MVPPDEWSLEQWREVATDLAQEKDAESGDESPKKKPGRPRINKKSTKNYILHIYNPETWQYKERKPRGRKHQLYYGHGIESIAYLMNSHDTAIKDNFSIRDRLEHVLNYLKKNNGGGYHDIKSVERALRRYNRTNIKNN